MFESFYIFHGTFYEQCGGVATGSPSGFTFANAFKCHFENIRLENYPFHFKHGTYQRLIVIIRYSCGYSYS